MKQPVQKHRDGAEDRPRFAAGPRAAALAPPAYGIGFVDGPAQATAPVQREQEPAAGASSNPAGMPDGLKSGIESLSGMDLSDVRVNFNSDRPARLNAFAYTQGSDIYLAPGQEKHLAHEAWHVVQQRQGRVKPTMLLKGAQINGDAHLEAEADAMGQRAMRARPGGPARPGTAARPATTAAGGGTIQRRVGLEIEIAVPVNALTVPQTTALRNHVVGLHPNQTAVQITQAQTLADAGRVGTLTHIVPPGMVNPGFHVDSDHDDRVKSPAGTWPPKEADDGILEIVMEPAVETDAELTTTMTNIQTFLNNLMVQTNNLTTHWQVAAGLGIGPLHFVPAYDTAGIPRTRQPNHNFRGSIQANVGVDLREYHSMLKWYANSRYGPRAPGGAVPAIGGQRQDMLDAVDIGRTAIADIRHGNLPGTVALTNVQRQQMGNMRGLRGWLTHCALALLRGAYTWGIDQSAKNIVPVLLKSPNDLVLHHGLTVAEANYYVAHKAAIINYLLAATNRVANDPVTGTRAFRMGGAGAGPAWTINQLFDETLNDAALIAPANIKNPSDVGLARTGNPQVQAIPDAPVLAGLGGGVGHRAGMVLEFRTIRGLYDGVHAWRDLARAFLRAADRRNRRSGLAP
jgi:hypothetical protein